MSDTAIGVIGALAGVVLGSVLTSLIDKRSWQRSESVTARLALAQVTAKVWADTEHQDLKITLASVRVWLSALDVDDPLIDRLEETAIKCWFSAWRSVSSPDPAADPGPGGYIDSELLSDLKIAVAMIDAELAGRRWF